MWIRLTIRPPRKILLHSQLVCTTPSHSWYKMSTHHLESAGDLIPWPAASLKLLPLPSQHQPGLQRPGIICKPPSSERSYPLVGWSVRPYLSQASSKSSYEGNKYPVTYPVEGETRLENYCPTTTVSGAECKYLPLPVEENSDWSWVCEENIATARQLSESSFSLLIPCQAQSWNLNLRMSSSSLQATKWSVD